MHGLLDSEEKDSVLTTSGVFALHRVVKLVIGLGLLAITVGLAVTIIAEPGSEVYQATWWPDDSPFMDFLSRILGKEPHNTAAEKEYVSHKEACCPKPEDTPLPTVRTVFSDTLTTVYGWPSTGGVWVHKCDAIELDFLGLPRFESSPTERFSKEEDDFCQRLELIGARFFENDHAYYVQVYLRHSSNHHSWYGWPAVVPDGGMWALWTQGETEPRLLQTARIRNALTMQERCRAIEMLGGRFYPNWRDAVQDFGTQSNETARLIATARAEAREILIDLTLEQDEL